MTDQQPTEEIPASGMFDRDLRERAVVEFGRDGAWLLLSQLSYGWRAYYDLAVALVTGQPPTNRADRPLPLDVDFNIARDLQVQGLMYSAAEQFAGVLRAARAHASGTESFLEAFVDGVNLGDLIDAVADLTVDEVAGLVGLPATVAELRAELVAIRPVVAGVMDLDPGAMETTNLGGLLVPRSVIDDGAEELALNNARHVVELIVANAIEIRALIERPEVDVMVDEPIVTQPLREVDNSFRHGFRVLLRDALPEPRRFRSAGGDAVDSPFLSELYLPKSPKAGLPVRFATVDCAPDRTAQHLDVLRQLCTRTGQFVRGFIGVKALGRSGLFVAAAALELPEPPELS